MRIGESSEEESWLKILPGCSRCRSDLEQEPNRAGDSGAGVRFCVDLVGCLLQDLTLFCSLHNAVANRRRWDWPDQGPQRVRVLMLLEKLDQTLPIREFINACIWRAATCYLPCFFIMKRVCLK